MGGFGVRGASRRTGPGTGTFLRGAGVSLLVLGGLGLGGCGGLESLAADGSREDGRPEVAARHPVRVGQAPDCEAVTLGARRVRRLSHDEYGNSVRALVDPEVAPEVKFSLDDVVNGYENDADALVVTPVLASQYRVAAEELAGVIRDGLADTLPCSAVPNLDPQGARACAALFIDAFGPRAFRRPITPQERDRYLALWDGIGPDEGLDEGIFWVAAAMLQSPHFLYRTELGVWDEARQAHVLTPHEVAAQLSYLITAGPPDAVLLEAAESGALSGETGSDELVAQAERLLASPEGGRAYADFAEAWLGVRRPRVAPDPDVYYPLTDELRTDMRGEYRRFAAHFFRYGRRFDELMTSPTSWVTPTLAAYYDLPPVLPEIGDADGFVRADLPPERAGLLARGRVLTVYADPAASAPTQRGKMVRERVLCESLPPPPPEVNTSPIPPNDDQTTRERHAQHTADPSCYSCHKFMDPIGFGFEHFDGIGIWRDTDNGKPVDASGEVVAGPGGVEGTFEGVDELGELLAHDPAVQACYVAQYTEFATAAPPEQNACLSETLQAAFAASDGRLDAPVYALVASRWFVERE